jgi:hypothetical protein
MENLWRKSKKMEKGENLKGWGQSVKIIGWIRKQQLFMLKVIDFTRRGYATETKPKVIPSQRRPAQTHMGISKCPVHRRWRQPSKGKPLFLKDQLSFF